MDQKKSMITYIGVSQLNETVEQLKKENETFIAVFKGGEDENGVNWCSDCVKADPTLKKALYPRAETEGIPVLVVNCGLRDEWKNPENPARIHPLFKVSGVPTAVLVNTKDEGGVTMKLAEDELFSEDMIEAFFE